MEEAEAILRGAAKENHIEAPEAIFTREEVSLTATFYDHTVMFNIRIMWQNLEIRAQFVPGPS